MFELNEAPRMPRELAGDVIDHALQTHGAMGLTIARRILDKRG